MARPDPLRQQALTSSALAASPTAIDTLAPVFFSSSQLLPVWLHCGRQLSRMPAPRKSARYRCS